MVRFKPKRIDRVNNNTPIVSDREIDEYAHAVLQDYKPELLRQPSKINYQHFLESYLDVRIEYFDIYSEDENHPILAMTVFKQGVVRIFDKENESVGGIVVPERTVIIDNYVIDSGKENLEMFSGLHEGGHVLMHWEVFTENYSLYDDERFDEQPQAIVSYRRESIEKPNMAKKLLTAEDWREHQANYFAAAIAMPNAAFIPFVNRRMRENGFYKGSITLGLDSDWDILAEDILPDAISETYGVSKRASRIKLKKCGFITKC